MRSISHRSKQLFSSPQKDVNAYPSAKYVLRIIPFVNHLWFTLQLFHPHHPVVSNTRMWSPLLFLSQFTGCGRTTWQTKKLCTVNPEICDDYGYNRGGKVADECGSWKDLIADLYSGRKILYVSLFCEPFNNRTPRNIKQQHDTR